MTATADMRSGRRSVPEYLAEPACKAPGGASTERRARLPLSSFASACPHPDSATLV